MIRIEITAEIERLAKEHCENVKNELEKDLDKKIKTIKNQYENELEKDLDKKIKTIKNQYEKDILDYIKNNLENILKEKPFELKEIIYKIESKIKKIRNNFNRIYSNEIKKEYLKSKTIKELKEIYKIGKFKEKDLMISYIIKHCYINNKRIFEFHIYQIIKNIFNNFYENKWDTIKNYTRYTFVKNLNIKVCPYCNRNYITVIQKDTKIDNENINRRPDVEHFYPKSLYPYLAMSFYNLLPACDTCNKIKSNFDSYKKGAKNPYEIKDNDFIFNYKIKNIDFMNIERNACKNQTNTNLNDNSIDIIFKDKIKGNIEMLGLDKAYEVHKDEVRKIILKTICYNKVYRDGLSKDFKGLNFKESDVFKYVFQDYLKEDNFQNDSLSKLKSDIFKNVRNNL